MKTTTRQQPFLETLTAKLRKINDPDPDIITNIGYRWSLRYIKRYDRKLPKLTFTPYGSDSKIKAGIMRSAGQGDIQDLKRKKAEWQEKSGFKVAQDKEDYILARRFNRKLAQYFRPIAESLSILVDPQARFTGKDQAVAEPIRLLMGEKITESAETPESMQEKPYNQALAELE